MLSIKGMLRLGFSVLLIFIIVESVIVSTVTNKNQKLVSDAISKDFKSSRQIAMIAIEGNKLRRYEKEFFIYADKVYKRVEYSEKWEDSYRLLKGMLTNSINNNSGIWSDNDIIEMRSWDRSLEKYAAGFRQVVIEVKSGKLKGTLPANAAIKEAKNAFRTLLDGAADYGVIKLRNAEGSVREVESNKSFVMLVLWLITVSGALLAIALLVFVPRAVINHVNLLEDAVNTIGRGNLSVPVPVESARAEFRGLAETLEKMRISQRSLTKRLKKYETVEPMS